MSLGLRRLMTLEVNAEDVFPYDYRALSIRESRSLHVDEVRNAHQDGRRP